MAKNNWKLPSDKIAKEYDKYPNHILSDKVYYIFNAHKRAKYDLRKALNLIEMITNVPIDTKPAYYVLKNQCEKFLKKYRK